ncbi:3-oxoacyl-[acyl-carrier-protein] synthase-3 [Microbacterium resistens]|uniref:3-oxoacyl-[acyl-carrier-protein] synthase-3 n=1 Tax=Microbacterium resistens TaxID=156977 RepID=A0ABU1S9N8_9MICO|nr:ketoacyl-ACP synthase III [Microbacterium resistens]MDR6866322.1 3-oxoacyl-[acyl-carrier-protein] synthase-3 [Microbacterium resistens]
MNARIAAVDYYVPEAVLSNEDLAEQFPEWSVDKIAAKTGIHRRHIAAADEFSSDIAIAAARSLFARHDIDPAGIDYVIVCTQSPDYFLPSTACIVQDALGIPTSAGATDITLGCSGYIYALGLAKGLIASGQASRVLVLTADTYTKFLNPADKSVRTIFGDGGSATLVTDDGGDEAITAITYGTDGSGAKSLIVPHGGLRAGTALQPKADAGARELEEGSYDLFMDGPEIFNFTLRVVPSSVESILGKAGLGLDDVDLFVFHQANAFMLEHLRKKLGVPEEKFFVGMGEFGNTVSSTIPIALAEAERQGTLKPGMRVMLLGFGVGLSWGGLITTW